MHKKDETPYKILLVEDNPGDILLIEDYLEEEILIPTVYTAPSFKEAAEVIKQERNDLDLILLDLSLPDKEGEDLIVKMIDLARDIPVIILTGYTDLTFAIRALSLGASDYLLKDSLSATVLYKSILYNLQRNKHILQLKESEHRYSELFHLSPQPMWVYDLETLKFLNVNEAAIKNYGFSNKEFMNMTIKDIRKEEDIPKLMETVDLSRGKDSFFFQGEFAHKKKNGEEIIVEIRSNMVSYNGRKAEIILATDITERYRYIRSIEAHIYKLKEIAWTQSHVVRAPLARIMGLIEQISDEGSSVNEKEALLPHVLRSAEELDTIIREIVDKAQPEENESPE